MYAEMIGINAYHQPGVEAGKKLLELHWSYNDEFSTEMQRMKIFQVMMENSSNFPYREMDVYNYCLSI